MKKNYFKNTIKFGMAAVFMMAIGTASAQSADGSDNAAQGDAAGPSIKLIDNKGTIKYMQSNNGITTITSTEPGNKTTTTWQLGGTLVEATTITAGANKFTIDGADFALESTTAESGAAAAADGADLVDGIANSGYTLLVRDEATGTIKKMLASQLVDVLWAEQTLGADTSADIDITATGILSTTSVNRVSVYRNGAKLRATTDYIVSADNTITVAIASIGTEAYSGDVFEVHWIK